MSGTETILIAVIVAAAAGYLLRRYAWRRGDCCQKPKPKRATLTLGGKPLR